LVLGGGAFCALLARGAAFCAEPAIPVKAAPPPAATSGPDAFDWSGLYLGFHMSYAWGRSGWSATSPGVEPRSGSLNFYQPPNAWNGAGSYFGGIQVGYNVVLPSRLMIGGEADISFPEDVSGGQTIVSNHIGLAIYAENVFTSGTLRGRIGYAFGNWLPYATAGFAWTFDQAVLQPPGTPLELWSINPTEQRLLWRLGWTIGAGVEIPFAPNWTVRVEYLFTDFGDRGIRLPASELRTESNLALSQIRVGVSYRLPDSPAGWSNLSASTIPPLLQDAALHAQTTFISQYAAPFRNPYEGRNSLSPNDGRESWDVTLFAGLRPWQGGEIWINPETDQGFALNDVHGIAGFPNADPGPGFSYPFVRLQRAFLRQTIDLGPRTEKVDADLNQFAMLQSTDRLVITAGKFSVGDIFDLNRYATDVRTDFMNLTIVGAGTFDTVQDAWGYTYGASAEWYQGSWTLRAGYFDLSTTPAGSTLDPHFGKVQYVGEVELRYSLWGQPGKSLVTGFLSHAQLGLYNAAVSLAQETGEPANLAAVSHYADRRGISMNFEQQINPDLGVFGRAGIADPNVEDYEVTDVDRTLVLGLSQGGKPWGRSNDTFGLAGVVNNISSAHQAFFNAGGLGIVVGDGMLPHPGLEKIVESYYKYNVSSLLDVTLDYQFVTNPGYNRDRGPVSVGAVRLHAEF
jgi:high affinity Mn2+ porin